MDVNYIEVSFDLHALATLPLGKEPSVPIIHWRVDGPQSLSGCFGEVKVYCP